MSSQRLKLSGLLLELGARYANGGLAIPEVFQTSDVHAYYRLVKDPVYTFHVRGDVAASSDSIAVMYVRMMDHYKMQELRKRGVPVGEENDAVLEEYAGSNGASIKTSYNALELQTLLTWLPQLRKFFLPPRL